MPERAGRPTKIPPRGWLQIAGRVFMALQRDNIWVVSAGVAFFTVLALFPAIGLLISLYGLVFDQTQAIDQLQQLAGGLPEEIQDLLGQQLTAVTGASTGSLTFGAVLGLLFTLWSSARGVKALMLALDIFYGVRETRNPIMFNLVALAFTLGGILFLVVTIALLVALPALIRFLPLGPLDQVLLLLARWPFLALAAVFAISVLYRYGADRKAPRWRWVMMGAVVATLLWVVVSVGFSRYVSSFGAYNEVYGSVGAVIVLLLWTFLSAYVVLLGAELNAAMERQATHPPRRMARSRFPGCDDRDRGGAWARRPGSCFACSTWRRLEQDARAGYSAGALGLRRQTADRMHARSGVADHQIAQQQAELVEQASHATTPGV